MEDFGAKLSSLRSEKNLSLKDVAHGVAIPESRLLELERGVRIPTEGQAERLAAYYGVAELPKPKTAAP